MLGLTEHDLVHVADRSSRAGSNSLVVRKSKPRGRKQQIFLRVRLYQGWNGVIVYSGNPLLKLRGPSRTVDVSSDGSSQLEWRRYEGVSSSKSDAAV